MANENTAKNQKKQSNNQSKEKTNGKSNGNPKDKSKVNSKGNFKGKPNQNKQALPKIEENFGDWFNEILFQADILDYRYNLKGCGVCLGYGFKIRRHTLNIIRELLDSTPIPHEEMLFPLLIPEPQFMKEAETVKGFEEEVYWVKDGGTTPLDVKLALRPTSETAMYPMAAKWIRSHQDLPLKTYQIVNTFRFEGKNTRPMIRVREITTFKEAHTYHKTAESCADQIREGIDCYKQFFDALAVPYIITQRPRWDTFPGANYTIAFDCIFPQKHRTLQIGTVHNLGTTFGETFDIKYEDVEGNQQFVHQTCYGISERGIAAIFASHGDDNGLKLPPMIAPIQAVIVPIIFKNKEQVVLDAATKFYNTLKKTGLRVHYDNRDMSSGKKYFHWELRGVPLRIEIGPRDVEKGKVCLVRRDTREKIFVPLDEAVEKINLLLDTIQQEMWDAAKNRYDAWILRTKDLDKALDFIEANKGIAEVPFCGSEECAATIEQKVDGLKFLGIPAEYLEVLTSQVKKEAECHCVECSKPVENYWRIGRPY